MSVISIDFGNESCYMSQARKGGIDTIVNGYGSRDTPSCVAFTMRNRLFGALAKNQQDSNIENTTNGFKHLLGKKFDDKYAKKETSKLNYEVVESTDGAIGMEVDYKLKKDQEERTVFRPEQITAMLLSQIVGEIEGDNADVVLTVPMYFTSSERQALLNAAEISQLNCLQLLNETTAIALNYGYYKQDDFDSIVSRNVAFIDFGHTSLQVSIVAFIKGKLQVLANTSVMIGGRDLDEKLAEYFCGQFMENYLIDPRNDKKSYARLMAEVQKLKKMMSTNKTNLKLKIDNFMGQVKVESTICRDQMDQICEQLYYKLKEITENCIARSELVMDGIHSVEITGGSSRIPAFKQMIQKIFGKPPSTTLNQDEAVSKGGAIFCAMKSKFVQLEHSIEIIDILSHHLIQVKLEYEDGIDTEAAILFDEVTKFPFAKKTALIELKNKKLPDKVYFINVDRPLTLDTWEFKWSEDQLDIVADAEKILLQLTLSIDINGILTLDGAIMEIERKVFETIKYKITIMHEMPKHFKTENETRLKLSEEETQDENKSGQCNSTTEGSLKLDSTKTKDLTQQQETSASEKQVDRGNSICFSTIVMMFNIMWLIVLKWFQSIAAYFSESSVSVSEDFESVIEYENLVPAPNQNRAHDTEIFDTTNRVINENIENSSLAILEAKPDTETTEKYEWETIEKTVESSHNVAIQMKQLIVPNNHVTHYQNVEMEMKRNDEHETQRSDARNSLEEFVFETRDQIDSFGTAENSDAVKANVKNSLQILDVVEKWLYSKGENCSRETYEKMRSEIKKFNMMKQIKRVDDKIKDEFKSLASLMNSIARNSVTDEC